MTDDQLPLGTTPRWTPSGDPRIDDAVARLADLADMGPADQAEVFDDVHRRLQAALSEASGS